MAVVIQSTTSDLIGAALIFVVVVAIVLVLGWLAVLRFGGGNHGGLDE